MVLELIEYMSKLGVNITLQTKLVHVSGSSNDVNILFNSIPDRQQFFQNNKKITF